MVTMKVCYLFFLLLSLAISGYRNANSATLSFEDDKLTSSWRSLNGSKTAIDTVNFRSGKNSLSVFRSLGVNGEPLIAGWESQLIPIQKNNEYTFCGYIATKEATGKTYLSIVWYKDDIKIGGSSSQILNGDNDWVFVYLTDIPPKEATHLCL
ncbi:MAG: hypothetical protein QXT84_05795 [Candidatus Bathyarchaeia archaeon]